MATSPEGEVLDETSLPGALFLDFFILTNNILDYVGGCRCVVLGRNGKFNFSNCSNLNWFSGTIYVGTTKNSIMKMNFEEEYSTIMQVSGFSI